MTVADGKAQFGQNVSGTSNTQSDQDWAVGGTSAVFTTSASTAAEVVAAALTPAGGPTPTPTPTPTATPTTTPTPTPTPTPSGGGASLMQSVTNATQNRTSTPSAAFGGPVGAGHGLVAAVAISGGNSYSVTRVTDSLGNTWVKAAAGVDPVYGVDVELWVSHASLSGADTVTVTLAGSGFDQANVSLAEFSAPLTAVGAAAGGSTGTVHSSGTVSGPGGALVVGAYGDAGLLTGVSTGDGKAQFAQNISPTVQTESDQSWGPASTSAVFNTSASATSEVVAAAFQTS